MITSLQSFETPQATPYIPNKFISDISQVNSTIPEGFSAKVQSVSAGFAIFKLPVVIFTSSKLGWIAKYFTKGLFWCCLKSRLVHVALLLSIFKNVFPSLSDFHHASEELRNTFWSKRRYWGHSLSKRFLHGFVQIYYSYRLRQFAFLRLSQNTKRFLFHEAFVESCAFHLFNWFCCRALVGTTFWSMSALNLYLRDYLY